jgi:hypothetical protein
MRRNMATPTVPNVEELEVVVTSWKGKDVGTVGQLVSPMIDDASDTYERLYQVEVGESVNIIFKFTTSEKRAEGVSEDIMGGKEVAREQEDEKISVLCQHEHPYLDKNVWLATKGRMDSTILKGNVLLLSVTLLQKVYC